MNSRKKKTSTNTLMITAIMRHSMSAKPAMRSFTLHGRLAITWTNTITGESTGVLPAREASRMTTTCKCTWVAPRISHTSLTHARLAISSSYTLSGALSPTFRLIITVDTPPIRVLVSTWIEMITGGRIGVSHASVASRTTTTYSRHLHGSAHYKNSIACPFCKRGFTAASGVANHIETGSCPRATNLNRESVYKAVSARDTCGVITNKFLKWDGAANAEYAATAASWNGHAYECYLCNRDFAALASLNQHLASPVHKQKLYRCFGLGCGKQFAALAPLFNHLESESCGAVRFGNVQKAAGNILTGQRRIEF
ncbi:uncharacterized protein RCC_03454 [Ramularia collo-cygni]|uniref:C2H2-type domain-containing protein n=1 Tax=Ramularia collo-cygni TaxID=112498 RepID=A0A2D3UZ16_9PEZI|nr:uncharacterized protein RCC_03454 [Ramularia collo-cygni]CZT17617.1 uncharacterized protein RCC_03454 [Ramularia collo-cygni]